MSLKEYVRKRDFRRTAEPRGKVLSNKSERRFVIQKHDASRLHYDFRLELGGTLKSWAVPKGMPLKKGAKALAIQVEDHPVAYYDFEGTIPKGQYGGGTVMVWDYGTFEPLTRAPLKDLEAGKLHFILQGGKLQGEWYLVQLKGKNKEGNEWLMIKGGENRPSLPAKVADRSARSGKTMAELAKSEVQWQSDAQKAVTLPAFVTPMMAQLRASAPPGDWRYEIKFDGWRAVALVGEGKVALLSRNETDLTEKFPEIAQTVAKLKLQDTVLDGEIVALDERGHSSFQKLQAYDLGSERPPLIYYVFDAPRLNGVDLSAEPLEKRQSRLARLLKDKKGVVRFSAPLGNDAELLMNKARELGLEGLIGKAAGSLYESGRRSGAWIKLKLHQEQEFVIGGWTKPEGARQHFGALIVGYYERGKLRCAGKVGTGFPHAVLAKLAALFKKHATDQCPFSDLPVPSESRWGQAITKAEMKNCQWLKPVLVAQVKFAEWTRDGRLRQPVFLGLRTDKPASQIIREKPAV